MLIWDTQALDMRAVPCLDSKKANLMEVKGCTTQETRISFEVQRAVLFSEVIFKVSFHHTETQSEIIE